MLVLLHTFAFTK